MPFISSVGLEASRMGSPEVASLFDFSRRGERLVFEIDFQESEGLVQRCVLPCRILSCSANSNGD